MKQHTHALVSGFAVVVAVSAVGCRWDMEGTEVSTKSDEGAADEKAIVGGSATSIADHPWQISLQTTGGFHFCGGSILSAEWILTANHCVEGATASSLRVVAGITKLSQASGGQTRAVAQIVRNPGFTSPEGGHDTALLRLSSPLTLGANAQPISFATPDDASAGVTSAGVTANVSGWGSLSSGGSSPDTLMAVNVPIVSDSIAAQRYGADFTSDQLAAGAGGKDSCQGDSGGPLTASSSRGTLLIGVVSWGYGCGDATYPGLYARVSSFASWITSTTGLTSTGGTGGNPGGTGGTTTTVTLFDQANLSGAKDSFQHFAVTVPAGATRVDVALTGSTGDADLYVRAGAQPTLSAYDCRPYTSSSNESCSVASPAAGTWYASIQGYVAFSGARLVVTATVPEGATGGTGGTGAVTLSTDAFSSWGAWTHAGDSALATGRARLRASTGDIRKTIDVTGATDLALAFSARVQSFESGDEAYVKVSADGGAFVTVGTFTSANSDDAVHAYTADLSQFDGARSLVVRFDAQMSSASDTLFIDDVSVTGTR